MSHVLVGLLTGDALGAPFETMHFSSPVLASWRGEYLGSTHHGTKAGEGTDDTLMALTLAEVLLEKEYRVETAAARYLDIYQRYPNRGWGKATTEALERLRNSRTWIPRPSDSEGNGSAMRAAPIGLKYSPKKAMEIARLDAVITHSTIEAQEGSAAIAAAVSMLRQKVEPQQVASAVVALLKPCKVRNRIQEHLLKEWDSTFQMMIDVGTGAHVVETVPAAIATLRTATSFPDAVVSAVKAGGDTDTTAAIVGALWGATQEPPPFLLEGLDRATRLQAEMLEKRILAVT